MYCSAISRILWYKTAYLKELIRFDSESVRCNGDFGYCVEYQSCINSSTLGKFGFNLDQFNRIDQPNIIDRENLKAFSFKVKYFLLYNPHPPSFLLPICNNIC